MKSSKLKKNLAEVKSSLSSTIDKLENKAGRKNKFLLTRAEYNRVVIEWNQTETNYPKDKTIYQLFEEQVEKTPDNIALIFGEQKLTYKELNEKANQLAHYLIKRGTKANSLVAVCLERSIKLVVSILAILKTGGAYVPVDTNYPIERINLIIDDSQPDLLITEHKHVSRYGLTNNKIIYLEDFSSLISNYNQNNLAIKPASTALAYIIYTSGSTGKPKGVMCTHQGIVNRVYWQQLAYPLFQEDCLLHKTSFGFDVSVWELFYPWIAGASLLLVNEQERFNVTNLIKLIKKHQVTAIQLVPSFMTVLLAEMAENELSSLRYIISGGEALTINLYKLILKKLPQIKLINYYAPTEVFGALHWNSNEKISSNTTVPIGRPIGNRTVYILDNQLQPVPVGVAGEIYLGGLGMSQGYLNNSKLTAEKFIPDLFSKNKNAKLYKTGDIGRWLFDGNIEYIGRSDFQVKIRGFRIELGEIESALLKYPSIKEVIVEAREDVPDNKYLAAYFIAENNNEINVSELKNYLAEILPDYMVPTAFMQLAAFPLTPNGKLDRKALPVPEITSSKAFIPPSNDTEKVIAAIWQKVLKLQQVGVQDNFFELGGHSLLATQVASRILHDLKQTISLQEFFRNPTVEYLARVINSSEKTIDHLPLVSISREQPIPLSFAQQRLWFLDQLKPNSPLYNITAILELRGNLNIRALEKAVNQLIDRHEVLRTQFVPINNQPVQHIIKELKIKLNFHDLTKLNDRENLAKEIIQAEMLKPFVLNEVPLLRAHLIRKSEKEYLFMFNIHHSICDGWSIPIIQHEISAFYNAAVKNIKLNLPELPVQYADFSIWQRKYLRNDGKVFQQQLQYWLRQLSAAPKVLELALDKLRPGTLSTEGANEHFILSKSVTNSLNQLAEQTGTTLFMVLLSAFYVLLYRYTGQTDIVVGSPIANRNRQEIESLIGFFVNTLALRGKLTHNLSFKELLLQVKQTTLEAYDHQDLPFEQLVEHLKLERDLSRNPLIQVMLILQNNAGSTIDLSDIDVKNTELDYPIAKFDLTLNLVETEKGLKGTFNYATTLFDADTIKRLARHWHTLIEAIIAQPTKEISQLQLLTPAEYQQIVYDWNQTATDYPKDKTIHQLFEEQAEKTPDKIAVVFDEEKLTYKELNERSNQLAHYLIEQGVKPDDLVAIYLERSIELIVSILAVLKAGGAYLPLSSDYPLERLQFMMQDSQAKLLITEEKFKWQSNFNKEIISILCIEQFQSLFKQINKIYNPKLTSSPQSLAYIIYTSGSTGQPKGVLIEHRGVVRLVKNTNYISITEKDYIAQASNIAFDAATFEIWGALLNGAGLVIVPKDILLNMLSLKETLLNSKINIMWLTAGLFNQIVQNDASIFATLDYLLIGGEALNTEFVNKVFSNKSLAPKYLINGYGPTENTTFTTCFAIQKKRWHNTIPIGKPVSNSQNYILDKCMHPVPIGVVGELYAAGDGVGRGYLNRPKLTAERFIANPFVTNKDKKNRKNLRLYKTGDLCRYLSDGNIEYIGRSDFQVKIRGFRIELGEIESKLLKHPEIREVTVQAREDVPDNKYLAAYFIAENNNEINVSELKNYLVETLPDYMVPTAFMQLEEFPLTPNGKLDRKALPVPEITSSKVFIAPRNDTEKAIASIWQEILKIDRVGVQDNFFELGGHSLLATQVVSRILHDLKQTVSLQEFFRNPTVEHLARVINSSEKTIDHLPLVSISREQPIPLSFAQQRLWFLDQLEPNSPLYNIPVFLQLKGELNVQVLEKAVNQLIVRHEILRTQFVLVGDKPVQHIIKELKIKLNFHDLTKLNDRENLAKEIIQAEMLKPFVLNEVPLLRAHLIRKSEKEYLFMFNIHHSICDGWSIPIIQHEISAFYNASVTGAELNLPELPVQYADFSVWQREYLKADGKILKKQLGYWQEKLANAPTVLELPLDRPRPAILSTKGANEYFILSKSVTENLNQLAGQTGTTLFMVLLSAFYVLLYRYTGQKDIVVGSPIANRNRQEIEPLIGFFVNTLALRGELTSNLSFKELLLQVKQTTLEAYEHQDLPFEQLIDQLKLERDPSRNPLVQVMLVLQNNAESIIDLNDMDAKNKKLDYPIAKFDLTLSLTETKTGLSGTVNYATALFDADTIKRLARHWHTLIEAIIAQPTKEISQLQLLTPAEYQQIVYDWNQTATDYPKDKTIHQLFEEQAEKTPDKIAVVFDEEKLTYKELNERSNQLAHYLIEQGVKPDDLVAIYLERSIELIVSILAVLKAGGAYLPLSSDYPLERLQFMMQDSQAKLLITEEKFKWQSNFNKEIISILCIEQFQSLFKQINKIYNPKLTSSPQSLAYIIYTSGSTGQPKGVLIEHRGVVRLVKNTNYISITEKDYIAQASNIAFDAATFEIWGALLNGAGLVIVPKDILLNMLSLKETLLNSKINIMWLTAGLFNQIVQNDASIFATLDYLLIGGEALNTEFVNKVFSNKSLAPKYLINGYGPTENTTFTTCFAIQKKRWHNTIPIGKPVSNSQNYILDKCMHPVPIGVVGELYAAGDGVGRGYLNRPKLTAERFIANPFVTNKDKKNRKNLRLYKTGDLCRYLSDGNIEYIGRSDFQVKIRGFRIELGEIESKLLKHPEIREVTVQAREDVPDNKYLAAYFIAENNNEINVSELKNYLVETLPDYMVPTAFMQLEEFPLTPNGKLDRKALPVPEITSSKAFIAPRNDTEKAIASIWQEILKIERVGVQDNFFELGGHSLLATQVVSRIQNQLGYKISLSEFFQKPTINSLSELTATRNKIDQTALAIKKIDRNKPVPLSFAQERLWFLDQLESGSALYNTPIVLRLIGKVELQILNEAINSLIQRHEILRTCFITVGEKPTQKTIDSLTIDINFTDLSNILSVNQVDKIKQEITNELLISFKLSELPLLKIKLIRIKNEEYILIINMHHILTDEWSSKIILQELSVIYNSKLNQKEIQLPLLAIQYADYAFWQRDYLSPNNEIYQKQISYWLQQLDSAPELLNLPTDYPRTKQASYEGATEMFELPVDLSEKIKKLAEQENMTLFMVLLAAFYILLYRHSGDTDLIIGSPIANRHPKETENIIGFFVNTLALRIKLDDEPTVTELLKRVREITLSAYDNQELPFEQIVEKLNIKRDLSFNPLFQVMLVVQKINQTNIFPLHGVKSEFEKLNYNLSRFDLTLSFNETENNLKGSVSFKTSLFSKETIKHLIEHLQILLIGMVTDQTLPISELPLLSEAEQEALIIAMNSN